MNITVLGAGAGGTTLAFKRAAGLAVEDDSIRIAETHTLHYAVRLAEPGRVHVFLKLKAGRCSNPDDRRHHPGLLGADEP